MSGSKGIDISREICYNTTVPNVSGFIFHAVHIMKGVISVTYFIGLDGGGTKTVGVLANREGQVLIRIQGPASNPNDRSPKESVAILTSMIHDLLEQGGLTEADLPHVSCFGGIAGGINHRQTLLDGLHATLPTLGCLDIRSDVHILLTGEIPEGDGACVICGTGSACFLRKNGELTRIGGWGYLLDSGGSGYDIGRDGLEAALRAHDGRGKPTILAEGLASHLGGEVQTKITEIYQKGKTYIASCAPIVFQAAEEGDEVAMAILRRNARSLAELIEAAWGWLIRDGQMPETLPVVMGGGISVGKAPAWQNEILAALDPSVPVSLQVSSVSPVFGAVVEAIRQGTLEGEKVNVSALREAFRQSYRKN